MIGFYNYTVIVTYLSLLSSVFGVYLAANGDPRAGLFCLMLSGFLDTFDGKIARMKKNRTVQEKRFGIQIDSLCDLVCFGVLPGIICYAAGLSSPLFIAIYGLLTLCALIRLAYFNVTEEERQDETDGPRKYYNGLPVTAISFLLPLLYLSQAISGGVSEIVFAVGLLVIAALFVTPIKVPKPGPKAVVLVILLGAGELAALLTLLP